MVSDGESSEGNDFGNFNLNEIHGIKYDDINQDGDQNEGEPPLSNWRIYIDTDNSNTNNSGDVNATTNESGEYWFLDLLDGTYTVREVVQEGWVQEEPIDPDE